MIVATLLSALVLGVFLAAVPHVLWLLAWIFSKIFDFSIHYAPFGWVALFLVAICWTTMFCGYFFGRFRLEIKPITYENAALPPQFSGYKIVHISDFHLGTFDRSPKVLQRFVDNINAQNPDLICFTGDLVTIGESELAPHIETLRKLHAKDGIASVFGNHDLLIYNKISPEKRAEGVQNLELAVREKLGWRLLRNEHFCIERNGEKITIVGVDNSSQRNQGFRTTNSGDLQKAMHNSDGFRILLTHDPSHWRAEVVGKTDIPLTLSGHTHAAQIRFFGWTPAAWVFSETDGIYRAENQTLYINVGLGCTMPIRINCPAEITVITLK